MSPVYGGDAIKLAERVFIVSKLVEARMKRKDLSEDEREFLNVIDFIMHYGEEVVRQRIPATLECYMEGGRWYKE